MLQSSLYADGLPSSLIYLYILEIEKKFFVVKMKKKNNCLLTYFLCRICSFTLTYHSIFSKVNLFMMFFIFRNTMFFKKRRIILK